MLKDIIEEYEEFGHIEKSDIDTLIKAAKLLVEIHEDVDSGMIDGVDLSWMTEADEIICEL